MKKKSFLCACVAAVAATGLLMSAMPGDPAITHENGTDVVNTLKIVRDIEGYNGFTPVKIYIKGDKVVKVEAMENQESPKYFARVKSVLLPKWAGKSVEQAKTMKVDVATGATYSSKCVIENVRRGLSYYQEHK